MSRDRNGEIGRRQTNDFINQLEGAGVRSEHIRRMQENPELREQVASLIIGDDIAPKDSKGETSRSEGTLEEGYRELSKNSSEEEDTHIYSGDLFDQQIKTLEDRGTPTQIVDMLVSQKNDVMAEASSRWASPDVLQFLPVIPRSYRSVYDLMAMVRNGEMVGHTELDPTDIVDLAETSCEPHYIYDVSLRDVRDILEGSVDWTVRKLFKKLSKECLALTLDEAIAFATHTDKLSKNDLMIVGSRDRSKSRIPAIQTHSHHGEKLTLSLVNDGTLLDGFKVLTCFSRIPLDGGWSIIN